MEGGRYKEGREDTTCCGGERKSGHEGQVKRILEKGRKAGREDGRGIGRHVPRDN